MTTHRSLNKLEFKAHMSIHQYVEVPESEGQGSRSTRDRFGKKHNLAESADANNPRRLEKAVFLPIVACSLFLISGQKVYADSLPAHRNTNIAVTSSEVEPFSLDDKLKEKDEKLVFYKDGSSTIGIDDDGNPSMNNRF